MDDQLPTSQVTFVFTDIEGSTRLLERIGDRYAAVLSDHRELLRNVFSFHTGDILGTEGDSFFVAFSSAIDAVKATIAAQLSLLGSEVRVRMGIHTGDVQETSEGYVGLAIHRAKRIASAGHGGQILVSRATGILVEPLLEVGTQLKHLGEYRLKDLFQPEPLFQVIHPELEAEFPQLRTLDALPNNLPTQSTSFIGREADLEQLRELVVDQRMVTLVGVGGGGKTRLALQAAATCADRFLDGVRLVELAEISEGSRVTEAVASVLAIRESSGADLVETIIDWLRSKKLLLILDNCEHVLDATVELAKRLLSGCPDLHILATSRESLRLDGESVLKVPPMDSATGVKLFIERAKAVETSFDLNADNSGSIMQLCDRLDGVPLAIELAAANVDAMTVEQINLRLSDRFELLKSRDPSTRQGSLEALFDWSYDQLPPHEATVFAQLSVFHGGFTLDAVERIWPDSGMLAALISLVRKSLVVKEEHVGSARYRMLDSLRHYAHIKLVNKGLTDQTRKQHLDWLSVLAGEANNHFAEGDQARWLDILETERDNFRSALDWSINAGEVQTALQIGGALGHFWNTRGYLSEGRHWLQRAIDAAEAGPPSSELGQALSAAGLLAGSQGDYVEARQIQERSLAIRRSLKDIEGVAASLNRLAVLSGEQGDFASAKPLLEECLTIQRSLNDESAILVSLINLGLIAQFAGDSDEATSLGRECLVLARRLEDKQRVAATLNFLGTLALQKKDLAAAEESLNESLSLMRELGDRAGVATCLINLASIAKRRLDHSLSLTQLKEAIQITREAGNLLLIAYGLEAIGSIAIATKNTQAGLRVLSAANALRVNLDTALPQSLSEDYDRDVTCAKAATSEEDFDSAWSRGQTMGLEKAIDLALELSV
ncbi:MAG: tetratricopeptide repeat protein [Actinomycetota bacterium]